jgi:O-Antigen ligase
MQTKFSTAKSPAPPLGHRPEGAAGVHSRVRKTAFYLGVALIFIRCSLLQETITYELNFNVYLLYIVGVLTLLALVVSRSLLRPFRFPPAHYWFGFVLWMTLAIPFSIWRAGSLALVEIYWRTDIIMLFAIGGLVTNWEECKTTFRAIALACVVSLLTVRLFGHLDAGGRMNLQFGAIANSNDYPAHLLMLLPSLLWVAFTGKVLVTRIAALAAFGYGISVMLASGSRGALIALTVGIVYFLFSASRKQRIVTLAFVTIVLVAAFSFMPQRAIRRIFSFSASSSSSSEEALESSEIRSHLLKDSIWYALKYPVFGLGPGNFGTAEGKTQAGFWYQTHNSYTEVASECGLPALIFFVGGIVSSFLIFRRIGREFEGHVRAREFTQAAFCMRLTIVMFCTAISFLNFAYSFYLPMIGGIAIAMGYAAGEWKVRMQSTSPDGVLKTHSDFSNRQVHERKQKRKKKTKEKHKQKHVFLPGFTRNN